MNRLKTEFGRPVLAAVALMLMIVLYAGCSGDGSKKADTDVTEDQRQEEVASRARFESGGFTEQQIDDLLAIEATMHEALTRWHYHDKAVLYDNEFEYLKDRWTLKEYLSQTKIIAMSADSVVGYEVTGGQFFGRDSVIVDDIVKFVGVTGVATDFVNKDKLYWHQGHWIRPTLSKMWEQLEFEELIRWADSAAAAEESEDF